MESLRVFGKQVRTEPDIIKATLLEKTGWMAEAIR